MSLAVGVVLAVLAAVGLAGQAITIRLATERGKPTDVLLVVMLVNVVVLLPLIPFVVSDYTITPWSVLAFGAAGIVGTILGRILFFSGIQRVGANRAEAIKGSMPLHATVLAIVLLGEHVSGLQLGGIALIVVGIALMSLEGRANTTGDGEPVSQAALALPLLAAVFYGLEPIFATVGLQAGTDVLVGLAIKTVTAFVAYLAYLRWRNQVPSVAELRAGRIQWYLLAGLANTGFLLAYYAGLSVSRVSVVVPIMYTSPFLVILLSAIFLRRLETVTPRLIVAASVIVAGGITVTLTG